jgi:hypothetical protein
VEALERLFAGPDPAIVKARAASIGAFYLMGDASGSGFGSALWKGEQLAYQARVHATYYAGQSSNFQEANNLVSRMEEEAVTGLLDDKECFIFTDNTAFEGTFYKGHSTSPVLTNIILRLRILQLRHSVILHVIHIAGTRMKAAGIDGLSWGNMLEGMMVRGTRLRQRAFERGELPHAAVALYRK